MVMSLVSMIMFISGVFVYSSKRKHLLMVLLSLEFIVLGLYLVTLCYLMTMNYEMYLIIMFLVFSVCEGALGLSILVSMVRSYGNDYFQSFSVFMC
uniref:NADH-ubiquinone oxidoreductase chain 4L n=1 Tax=Cylindraustralia sp. HS-2014 TaxID=1564207 RepID=A0A0N7ARX4_9ORTH|nr:NADH dehydrogenase subunit 4L [Cylindraustralia sp. HS-2014]